LFDNDRQITISAGNSRRAAKWQARTLYISELYKQLETPARGAESYADYMRMTKPQQDDLKDVGGFVAGSLRDGRRKGNAVTGRDVLTLDLDPYPCRRYRRRASPSGWSWLRLCNILHSEAFTQRAPFTYPATTRPHSHSRRVRAHSPQSCGAYRHRNV
jgi:hypothetical protein